MTEWKTDLLLYKGNNIVDRYLFQLWKNLLDYRVPLYCMLTDVKNEMIKKSILELTYSSQDRCW